MVGSSGSVIGAGTHWALVGSGGAPLGVGMQVAPPSPMPPINTVRQVFLVGSRSLAAVTTVFILSFGQFQ